MAFLLTPPCPLFLFVKFFCDILLFKELINYGIST
nr:MAG TPA: hypothetical protein [Caudoviricetes sp.]DAT31426.1 MAG TPA: hypothetical protein [Caudoviricetes sp.]